MFLFQFLLTEHCRLDSEQWSEWTVCSVTCGGGKRTKTRECVLPDGARSSDLYCEGKNMIVEECNNNKCPGKCPCPLY